MAEANVNRHAGKGRTALKDPLEMPRVADRTPTVHEFRTAVTHELARALSEIGYELQARLGQGGMSQVYLARSESAAELVAVKVLHHAVSRDPVRLKRFVQEYNITSRINSPHVMRLYDRGFEEDFAFTVTEYFPGGSLDQRMQQGIDTEQAVEYLREIAHALAAAHRLGIVHRDVKPANILFRADDTLALIDFGLATTLDRDMNLTATGNVLGTPFYMSPEQVLQEKPDARSDLYSLGILAHELLCGAKPFDVSSLHGLLRAHLMTPVPALPEHLAAFQPLINKLTAKKPVDRYHDAGECIEALAGIVLR